LQGAFAYFVCTQAYRPVFRKLLSTSFTIVFFKYYQTKNVIFIVTILINYGIIVNVIPAMHMYVLYFHECTEKPDSLNIFGENFNFGFPNISQRTNNIRIYKYHGKRQDMAIISDNARR
jgi:hypothetical protein